MFFRHEKVFVGMFRNSGSAASFFGLPAKIASGAAWELRGNELMRGVYLGEAIPDQP
jgi:hypothetical protein